MSTGGEEPWRVLRCYGAKPPLEPVYVLEQRTKAAGTERRLRSMHLGVPNVTPETVMLWTRAAAAEWPQLWVGLSIGLLAGLAARGASVGFAAALCVSAAVTSRARARRQPDDWALDPLHFDKPYAKYTVLGLVLAGVDGRSAPAAADGASSLSALMIGLGGGSLVHFWRRVMPGCTIDAVEISWAVISAAREFFDVAECAAGRTRVIEGDGAEFIASAHDAAYRIVMCDLDVGTLVKDDSIQHLRRIVAPGGVLVQNVFLEAKGARRLVLLGNVLQQLLAQFAEVHIVRTTPRNSMFVALPQASGLSTADAIARSSALCAALQLPFDLGQLLAENDTYTIRRRRGEA